MSTAGEAEPEARRAREVAGTTIHAVNLLYRHGNH